MAGEGAHISGGVFAAAAPNGKMAVPPIILTCPIPRWRSGVRDPR
jgi:hypothetical protein